MKSKFKLKEFMLEVVYFSSWIANLGVVPLFLFSAFLLDPLFFLLFLRIIFVCFVFEAIISSYIHVFKKIRAVFVAEVRIKVKGILLVVFTLLTNNNRLHASTISKHIKYIQKGEQLALNFTPNSQYSVGNSKTINTKYLPKKRVLMIKGIKQGLSDLVLWNSKGTLYYKIYVIGQKQSLNKLNLYSFLNENKFKYKATGSFLTIKEPINNIQTFEIIQKLCLKSPKISCQGNLSPSLQKKIITRIYSIFLSHHQPNIECKNIGLGHTCSYIANEKLNFNSRLKSLSKKWRITFQKTAIKQNQNFKVSFKFFQIESNLQEARNFGLEQVTSKLLPVLQGSTSSILEENNITLNNQKVTTKLLAEPQVITTLNESNEIKIGQDQSFESSTNLTNTSRQLSWKFAGFSIKFKLFRKQQQLLSKYHARFTSHQGGAINGSQKKSTLVISPNRNNLLFKVNLQDYKHANSKLPFFSRLPILGKLFKGNSKQKQRQFIIGIMNVSELGDNISDEL